MFPASTLTFRSGLPRIFCVFLLGIVIFRGGASAQDVGRAAARESQRPVLLAHYMPWYVADHQTDSWGWHWTMNHFDPSEETDGRRSIASQFYPLIGPYDSGDPHVIEYHLLLMKLAGIDGVIVDWYGLADFRDYAILHRNTLALVEQAEKLNMRFVICYEDQTIEALTDERRLLPEQRVGHAQSELGWLQENWFAKPNYVRLNQLPVLLSFGFSGLSDKEWTQCLAGLAQPLAYFSEHRRREGAVGAFDWPVPREGLVANQRFLETARQWPQSIPVAFPRFVDIYEHAQLHKSYGTIEDRNGLTLRRTLAAAFRSKASIVQLATWNDWGEGTQIEPSVEYGYRDLEWIQKQRATPGTGADLPRPGDLRLPLRLYRQRIAARQLGTQQQTQRHQKLDRIAKALAEGRVDEAQRELQTLPAVNPTLN